MIDCSNLYVNSFNCVQIELLPFTLANRLKETSRDLLNWINSMNVEMSIETSSGILYAAMRFYSRFSLTVLRELPFEMFLTFLWVDL